MLEGHRHVRGLHLVWGALRLLTPSQPATAAARPHPCVSSSHTRHDNSTPAPCSLLRRLCTRSRGFSSWTTTATGSLSRLACRPATCSCGLAGRARPLPALWCWLAATVLAGCRVGTRSLPLSATLGPCAGHAQPSCASCTHMPAACRLPGLDAAAEAVRRHPRALPLSPAEHLFLLHLTRPLITPTPTCIQTTNTVLRRHVPHHQGAGAPLSRFPPPPSPLC